MATPTYAQVITQINTYIVANGNNEITADVLNPILILLADFANNNIGDLDDLTTDQKETIVDAINSLKNNFDDLVNNGVQLYTGINDPNSTPPPTYKYADFYMQVDIDSLPVKLWQWNGFVWTDASEEPATESDNVLNNSDVDGVTVTDALNNIQTEIDGLVVPENTDDITNVSSVSGTTATDALNTLNSKPHNSLSGLQGGAVNDYQHLTTAQLNSIVSNPANFTAGRIPYTTGTNSLADSTRLLWNNTSSILELNGTNPILRIKNNLNNYAQYWNINGNGDLFLKNHENKQILQIGNPTGVNQPTFAIGDFSGGTPAESQLYVYGGVTGANIDARGSASIDEANIDLENNEWATDPKGLGFTYLGPLRTGLTPILGYAANNLGNIRFNNIATALITSNNTSTVTPIRFGINSVEIVNVNDKGASYQSNFASVNSSNPRWLVDKAYADGLVVGLLDDRGSYNASTNLFPSTGGSGTSGAILKGDLWYVSVAGTLGGKTVNIGDSFRALVDSPGQTSTNWSILSSNIGYVPENQANKSDSYTVSSSTTYTSTKALVDGLALKANDANVIHTTGNETKTGNLYLDGNLGVGTSPLTNKLTVLQSNNSTSLVVKNGSTSAHNVLYAGNDSSTNSSFLGSYKGDDSNFSYFVLQKFGGNVGVGVMSDDGVNKLQVNGTISASAAANSNQVVIKSQLDSAIRPYKVYTALLTQSGTSAPTVTVLENTLAGSITWARTASGQFTGTLSGAFTANKFFGQFQMQTAASGSTYTSSLGWGSVNLINFFTYNNGVFTDNITGFIELRVYN